MFSSEVLEILRATFLQNTSGQLILRCLKKVKFLDYTIVIIFLRTSIEELLIQIANLSYISFFVTAECVKYYSFFEQLKIVHGLAHHGVLGTTVKSTTKQYVGMVSSFERKNTVCVGIMMCKGTVMSVVSPQLK